MRQALQMHIRRDAVVIPVPLRPTVRWEEMPEEIPIGNLQASPRNKKPITERRNRDAVLAEIVTDISKVVTDLLARKQQNALLTQAARRQPSKFTKIMGYACVSCGARNNPESSNCKKCGDLLLNIEKDAQIVFVPDAYEDDITKLPSFLNSITPELAAISISQETSEGWIKKGDNYRYRKQYLWAIVAYTCAIQLDPLAASVAPAYFNRGLAYLELHQTQHAIADFNGAYQLVLGEARKS